MRRSLLKEEDGKAFFPGKAKSPAKAWAWEFMSVQNKEGFNVVRKELRGRQEEAERGLGGSFPGALCAKLRSLS